MEQLVDAQNGGHISLMKHVKQNCFIVKTNGLSLSGSESLEGEGTVMCKAR